MTVVAVPMGLLPVAHLATVEAHEPRTGAGTDHAAYVDVIRLCRPQDAIPWDARTAPTADNLDQVLATPNVCPTCRTAYQRMTQPPADDGADELGTPSLLNLL